MNSCLGRFDLLKLKAISSGLPRCREIEESLRCAFENSVDITQIRSIHNQLQSRACSIVCLLRKDMVTDLVAISKLDSAAHQTNFETVLSCTVEQNREGKVSMEVC